MGRGFDANKSVFVSASPYSRIIKSRRPFTAAEEHRMSNSDAEDTAEITMPHSPLHPPWPQTGSARVQVDLAALSHPGLIRAANEDHFLVARFGRSLETLLTNLPPDDVPARADEVGYGLLVADGMGGAAAGALASRTAISTLVSLALQTPDWILSTGEQETDEVLQRMEERYSQVDVTLRERSHEDVSLSGMGTTMTLACSLGSVLVIGHVGDSRAYLFRNKDLHQLTRDHTFVQVMIDVGSLTKEQAATHPFRHVLTRALGGSGPPVKGDFQRAYVADGDQLLLCTDGLTEMVNREAIASILGSAATAEEACQALVDRALENGGKDNVTVVLARYRFAD
jgi:protein phosphatase